MISTLHKGNFVYELFIIILVTTNIGKQTYSLEILEFGLKYFYCCIKKSFFYAVTGLPRDQLRFCKNL